MKTPEQMMDEIERSFHGEEDTPERIKALHEAAALTGGARNSAYGEPVANMQHTADVFNAMTGRDLSAREASLFMEAVKIARRVKNPLHRDSYVDGMAYTGMTYECALMEAPQKPSPKREGRLCACAPEEEACGVCCRAADKGSIAARLANAETVPGRKFNSIAQALQAAEAIHAIRLEETMPDLAPDELVALLAPTRDDDRPAAPDDAVAVFVIRKEGADADA